MGKKTKKEVLSELEKTVTKIPKKEKINFSHEFFVGIISALAKRLVKYEGYSRVKRILEREIKKLGRKDATRARKLLKIKKISEENISKIMKFIALVLGFKLEVRGNETYVKNCPFAVMARRFKEPLIAEICSWYCEGIAEELAGEKYEWKGFHNFMKNPTECYFIHRKRKV